MGEIAEMHLDGTLCERCGEYLGHAVGYPRYCRDCWKEMSPEEKGWATMYKLTAIAEQRRTKHKQKRKTK